MAAGLTQTSGNAVAGKVNLAVTQGKVFPSVEAAIEDQASGRPYRIGGSVVMANSPQEAGFLFGCVKAGHEPELVKKPERYEAMQAVLSRRLGKGE